MNPKAKRLSQMKLEIAEYAKSGDPRFAAAMRAAMKYFETGIEITTVTDEETKIEPTDILSELTQNWNA